MNSAMLRKIVEDRIANLDGNAFQDLCDRLCMKLFPNDYTPVRAGGPKGDLKNDGYCPKARIFFAAHATRGEKVAKTKKKIRSDLEGCLKNHPDVRTWTFLTNDTLLGEVEAYVDELRTRHPNVTIETWGHKIISETICAKFAQSIVEEIIDMGIGPTVEINAEIEHARDLLERSLPSEARVALERLWSQHNDKMSARQRFRVQANIGHSYQAQGESQEAARYFLLAKQYEPMYEKARTLEALAYLLLGNVGKAEELSRSLIADFPEETLAVAVHVRSTPKEVSFDEVKEAVSGHLLSDPEVALALAEAAVVRDLPETAESYAAQARNRLGFNAVAGEALADAMVMRARLHERFAQKRTATKEEIDHLEKAHNLYTDAISALGPQNLPKRVARLRLKRSEVSLALDRDDEWEKDCTVAYELDPSNEEAVFKYAAIREKRGDLDEAIRLTEGLLGERVRPIVELRLAQLLLERGGPNDRSRSRELLLSRLGDLSKESPEVCVEYLSWLSDVERQINGLGAGIALLDGVAKDLIDHQSALLLKAELLRIGGNLEEAIKLARELAPLVTESTRSDTTRRTATLLQALGLHRDALRLWKRVVRSDYIGTDTFRAIECAQRCDDVQYVLDLSSSLRANGIWDKRVFELELTYRAQYNDTATEVAILQDFLTHPLDADYVPEARLRLSVAGIRTGRSELIETDPLKLPRVTEVSPFIGQHVVEVLRRGPNPMLAATYAYEMVRSHWDDPHAHSTMARIFFPDGPVPSIREPDRVVPGAAVYYKEDDTQRGSWYIIEDSPLGKPNGALHEYPLNSTLSQAMLGKKAGEKFYLVRDEIQERTATIMEVMSKYKYRFNASLRELSTRFSHTGFVREITIEKNEDKFNFSVLERLAEKRAESVQKLEEIYRHNLCPLYLLANAGGRSVIETMEYVIDGTDLKLRCCLGSDEEQGEATSSLSTAKSAILDSTALATLFFTESYSAIDKLPLELAVTEGTLNDLRGNPILRGDPETHVGSFSTHGFSRTSLESIIKWRTSLQALIAFVETKCAIRSGTVVASLVPERREQLLRIFGQPALESILAASQSESVLWTDDLATAAFAKTESGCRRVWSQLVFEYLAGKGVLPQSVSDEVVAQLFGMRYYYLRPSVSVIIKAIKRSKGDVDVPPLREALNWFSDANAKREGQFIIAGGVLKALWQSSLWDAQAQSITIRILERLAQRPGGMDIIQGLLQGIDRIFGLDVVNGRKAHQVIRAWLKGHATKIIIP